jgi:hypothetical protein
MTIEKFGNADKLMIDNALFDHGGHAMIRRSAAPEALFRDLAGFEQCLQLAAGRSRLSHSPTRGASAYARRTSAERAQF